MKKILFILLAFLSLSINPIFVDAQSKAKHKKQQVKTVVVYITKTGAKYHLDGCQYLRRSQIEISKSDAINQGYTACSKCF